MDLKAVKLGKKVELKYIPFSELAIPWNIYVDSPEPAPEGSETKQLDISAHGTITANGSKTSKTLKRRELDALKRSIAQFGLLKPFEVAELPDDRLDYFYGGKGKYLVIDGQRRYFAIRELLGLPTEQDEKKHKDSLRTNSGNDQVDIGEMQAQQQFDRLSLRDYVLIPCLVYPYKTFLQMMRHSVEDRRFSEKPSKDDVEIVEKMRREGVPDITPEDVTELLETRGRIEQERQAIEKTLQEIRNRTKPETNQTLATEEEPMKAHS